MFRFGCKHIVLCLVLSCVFTACRRERYHEPDVYDRVILFYLDGKENNLSSFIIQNYNEIMSGYVPRPKTSDVMLVYIHNDRWPAQLIRLTKENGYVKEQLIKEFSFSVSTQPAVIRQILNFTAERFPAYQNGLLISSHGSGYLPCGYYKSPADFISYKSGVDDSSSLGARPVHVIDDYDFNTTGTKSTKSIGADLSNSTDIMDLAEMLPIKYDFLIFDCCLMGGVEVAYQLRNKVDNIIFSQTEILASGVDYRNISSALFEKGNPDLRRICTDYMNLYINSSDPSATISYVKTRRLDSLAAICNKIMSYSTENIKTLDRSELQRFFRSYSPVGRDFFYDLDDYVKALATDSDYVQFRNCMDSVVVCAYHTDGFMLYDRGFYLDRNCGLSVYAPLNYQPWHTYLNKCYRLLDWCKDVYGDDESSSYPYL